MIFIFSFYFFDFKNFFNNLYNDKNFFFSILLLYLQHYFLLRLIILISIEYNEKFYVIIDLFIINKSI